MQRGPENYLFSAQQNITKNVPYKVVSKLYQGHTLLYCDTLNELWFLPMTLCTTLYFLATASEKSTLIQGLHASNFRLIF